MSRKKRISKIKRPCRLTVEEEEDGNISCEQETWRKPLLPNPPNVVFGFLQEHSKLKGKSVSAPLDVEGVESSPSAFSDIAGNDGDQRLWTKLKNET